MGNCMSRKKGQEKDYKKIRAPKTPIKGDDPNSNADAAVKCKKEVKQESKNGSNKGQNGHTSLHNDGNNEKKNSSECIDILKNETKKDTEERDKKTEKQEEINEEKEAEKLDENMKESKDIPITLKEKDNHNLSTSWVVFEEPEYKSKSTEKSDSSSSSCLENKEKGGEQNEIDDTVAQGIKDERNDAAVKDNGTKNDHEENDADLGDDDGKDDTISTADAKQPLLHQPHPEKEAAASADVCEDKNATEISEVRKQESASKKVEDESSDKKTDDETLTSETAEQNAEVKGLEKRLDGLQGETEVSHEKGGISEKFVDFKATVFLETLADINLSLQKLKIDGRKITGIIAVAKLKQATQVLVRHTFDAWKSFLDIEARKTKNESENVDLFSFCLEVPSERSVEFAISCKTLYFEQWDNNDGKNYKIESKTENGREKLTALFIPGEEEAFIDRLSKTHLCFENAYISDGKAKISIGVDKHQNVSKVGVKYTVDSWKSNIKVEAVPDEKNQSESLYNTFTALLRVPKRANKLEFALFLEDGDVKFWDNHNGSNYSITFE